MVHFSAEGFKCQPVHVYREQPENRLEYLLTAMRDPFDYADRTDKQPL